MRNRNSVKQLGKTHSHRNAMFANMVTSLFEHERIITTKQKGKELKRISEKMITRAKKNLEYGSEEESKKLHNKREVMKTIKNRDVVKKLFDDLAARFKDRPGGYTRMYLIGKRPGDAAEMAIVELVDRNTKAETKDSGKSSETKEKKKAKKDSKKEAKKDK